MKALRIWRLESGILTIVISFAVSFPAGIIILSGGDKLLFWEFIFSLSAGIAATVFWKDNSKGGDISLIIQYVLAAILGIVRAYENSEIGYMTIWALLCAGVAGYSWYLNNSKVDDEEVFEYETPQSTSNTAQKECPNCHAIVDMNSTFCGACGQRIPKQSFCKNCGNPLEPEALFCPKCGTKQC